MLHKKEYEQNKNLIELKSKIEGWRNEGQ